jgi:hypothetical protein
MKTKLLLFFALIWATSSFSQADYITYNSTYGSVYNMIHTSDGGVAMLIAGLDQNPIVLKTSATGVIQWQQKITFNGASVMFQLTETTDLGIAVLTSDNSGGIVLIKLNSSGVYQWTKRYNYSLSNQGWSIVGNSTNGVTIVGNGCAGHNFVIYTDATGTITWSKQYVNAAFTSSTGSDVIMSSANEFIVTGFETNSSSQVGFIMSVTNTGSLNWFKEFDFGAGNTCQPKRVIKTSDGGYSIVGQLNVSNVGRTFLVHTTSAGVVSFTKTFAFSQSSACTDLIQKSDNSYILCGSVTHSGNQNIQELIIHADANGSLLWARSDGNSLYSQSGYDGAIDVEYNSGNKYFMTGASDGMVLWTMSDSIGFCHGFTETPTVASPVNTLTSPTVNPTSITFTTTTLTATTASPGLVPQTLCSHPTGINENNETDVTMNLFPNPAHGSVHLSIDQLMLQNGTLKISDVLGNVVYEENLPAINGIFSEDITTSFSPGIYFVRINSGEKYFVKKLVVE